MTQDNEFRELDEALCPKPGGGVLILVVMMHFLIECNHHSFAVNETASSANKCICMIRRQPCLVVAKN